MVRHDTYLSSTTNIASKPEFAKRKRRSTDPEYAGRDDWWISDFTAAELKTLRAVQSFRGDRKCSTGSIEIPTFDEVLALATSRKTVADEAVCVYPEAKSPAYFASVGQPDMAENSRCAGQAWARREGIACLHPVVQSRTSCRRSTA